MLIVLMHYEQEKAVNLQYHLWINIAKFWQHPAQCTLSACHIVAYIIVGAETGKKQLPYLECPTPSQFEPKCGFLASLKGCNWRFVVSFDNLERRHIKYSTAPPTWPPPLFWCHQSRAETAEKLKLQRCGGENISTAPPPRLPMSWSGSGSSGVVLKLRSPNINFVPALVHIITVLSN